MPTPTNPIDPQDGWIKPFLEDGTYGIWVAGDVDPLVPRSPTRKDTAAAWAIDPLDIVIRPPVGPGSINDLVKVRLKDFIRRGFRKQAATKVEPLEVRFPHTCPLCGGRMLQLFSSIDHMGPDGQGGAQCPGSQKPKSKWR